MPEESRKIQHPGVVGGLPPATGGPQSVIVRITDETAVGSARRAAARLALDAGMSESDAGSVALIATEAATNIARYGRDGAMILSDVRSRGRAMIELIAIDKGPGIPDVTRAMSDGFSTGGTRGQGLGAIKRLAAEFDIWTSSRHGTAILARVPLSRTQDSAMRPSTGVVCIAIANERVSGDGWIIEDVPGGSLLAVADGLGHGPEAAEAASAALEVVKRRKHSTFADMFDYADRALRGTRGAALQLVKTIERSGTMLSAGVGNISTSVSTNGGFKSAPSHPGIVGHQMPRVQEVVIPCTSESLIIMHSDGISARWRLEEYPGLQSHDPALVAAVLYRDFARSRDDVTVLAYRAA